MALVFEMSTKSGKIVLHTAKGRTLGMRVAIIVNNIIKVENTITILKLPSRRCSMSCKPDFALSFHERAEYANLCKA